MMSFSTTMIQKKRRNNIIVAIAIRSFAEYSTKPLDILKSYGYKLLRNETGERLSEDALANLLENADGVIAGTENYSQKSLEKAKRLKVISRVGIGIDNIDLEYTSKRGIKVLNTPDAPSWAVAEHTIAMVLSLLKKIPDYNSRIRKGNWKAVEGYMLRDKVVGIVGLGRIGQKVGLLFASLGCRVIGYDPYINTGDVSRVVEVKRDLKDVLRVADILTLHIPLTKENYHFIAEREIEIMKRGSFIINTSRGGVLDEEALYRALKKGHLAGAGLDVFEKEPYAGPLLKLENVIVTPHVASNAKEARIAMEIEAVNNLISELNRIFKGSIPK